jgi:hypothetical protein
MSVDDFESKIKEIMKEESSIGSIVRDLKTESN